MCVIVTFIFHQLLENYSSEEIRNIIGEVCKTELLIRFDCFDRDLVDIPFTSSKNRYKNEKSQKMNDA